VVFPPAIHLLLIFPAQATAVIQVYQEPADRLAFQELADVVAQAAILVILEFREQAVIRVLAPAEQAASQVLPPLASLATLVYQELLVILVWEHLVRLANQVHQLLEQVVTLVIQVYLALAVILASELLALLVIAVILEFQERVDHQALQAPADVPAQVAILVTLLAHPIMK
jgi:hypothetical protein